MKPTLPAEKNSVLADVVSRLTAQVVPSGQTWGAVAARAGVHRNTLYHLRRGQHRVGAERDITLWRTLRRLARSLGLPDTALLPRLPAPTSAGEAVAQALLARDTDGLWLAAQTGLSEGVIYGLIRGDYPARLTPSARARLLAALPELADSAYFTV